jgi:hypothetical protein
MDWNPNRLLPAYGVVGVYGLVFLLIAIVHITFALGVWDDARRFRAQRTGPFLVSPGMWALATLMGGMLAVGVYWLIHHSSLRRASSPYREAELEARQQ